MPTVSLVLNSLVLCRDHLGHYSGSRNAVSPRHPHSSPKPLPPCPPLEEHLNTFNSVSKVDVSNRPQMALMHSYLRHNMGLVDFWLARCVLPSESRQFPKRLIASAWNLADGRTSYRTQPTSGNNSYRGGGGGVVVGFSGTDDTHRLLPLQVHQSQPDDPSLTATNGKMLHVIMEHCLDVIDLGQRTPPIPPLEEQVVQQAGTSAQYVVR